MLSPARPKAIREPSPARGLVALGIVGLLLAPACNTDSPSSPNPSSDLTGQNVNQAATFNGTITVSTSGTAPADNASDAIVQAEVNDLAGNPVANGTPVAFFTTLGTVRDPGASPVGAGSSTQVIAWGGIAQVAVRSASAGAAVITVSVGDKASSGQIVFTPVETSMFISMAVRGGSGDSSTLQTTAPAEVTVVATVRDGNGATVPGRQVRFEIVEDSTRGTRSTAQFLGPVTTTTNSAGEAFNVVKIIGIGSVTMLAELLDEEGLVAVAESNQVIVTTQTDLQQVAISLEFSTGATFAQITAPSSLGLEATVRDGVTGELLTGRRVKFVIVSDTAGETNPASLASTGSSFTDVVGKASNAIVVREQGSTVVIIAELLKPDGTKEAESNQVTVVADTVLEQVAVRLEFQAGGTFANFTAPGSVGIIATVTVQPLGTPLRGRTVRFRIVEDNSLTTPASLSTTGSGTTNDTGQTSNAITVTDANAQVAIIAEVLRGDGTVEATSNQITVATN